LQVDRKLSNYSSFWLPQTTKCWQSGRVVPYTMYLPWRQEEGCCVKVHIATSTRRPDFNGKRRNPELAIGDTTSIAMTALLPNSLLSVGFTSPSLFLGALYLLCHCRFACSLILAFVAEQARQKMPCRIATGCMRLRTLPLSGAQNTA
jgi:hypothetical protein